MATSSDKSARIVTRGETSNFKVSFFVDEARTQPLVPLNSNYPQYAIYDLSGTPIQSGVGTQTNAGQYVASFNVPKDAKLSYFNQTPQTYNDNNQGMQLTSADSGRYRIEWSMVTAENYQVNFVEEFDVKDVAVTKAQSRELKYMCLAGKAVTVSFRVTELPAKAKMQLFIRGNNETAEVEASIDRTGPVEIGDLKYAKDGDSYVLYYDIADGVTLPNTGYVVMWEIQDKIFAPAYYEFQVLTAVTNSLFPIITTLRMLIDKFQVRVGRVQAYEDSDLLEYLSQGLRLVNSKYPSTNYSVANVPDEIMYFVTIAAGVYALRAQSLLNAQLNFNFSGQNVTLSVDNNSQLDAVAQNMITELNENLAPVKMTYVRKSRGIGTVATRGIGYNRANTMVFRVGSGNSPNMSNWLMKIGLL